MHFIYSLMLAFWGLVMFPVSLYRFWRGYKPVPNPRQSLGFLPDNLRSDGRPTIWFHSCSVGETLSVGPLAEALHQQFPGSRLLFSTITHTGQEIALQRYQKYGAGNTFYFPFDFPFIVQRVFDWIQPAMMVIIDVEIWPNVVREARNRNIPIALCNGRISADAYRFYRLVYPFLKRTLQSYSLLMMKSQEDASRIRNMGAPPEKILVTGNIKCDRDLVEKEVRHAQTENLVQAFGLHNDQGPLIVAGCTHPPEEAMLLEVFGRVRGQAGLESVRLMLAPRHPERFGEVLELATQKGFRVKRRTDGAPQEEAAEVLILDSMGELATVYQFATIAFVGGTLIPHGGQSVLEPAFYGKPIVIGPSMENFPQIIDDFLQRQAVVQIPTTSAHPDKQIEQLTRIFTELLRDNTARTRLGKAASAVLEDSRGASALTVSRLAALYETALQARH